MQGGVAAQRVVPGAPLSVRTYPLASGEGTALPLPDGAEEIRVLKSILGTHLLIQRGATWRIIGRTLARCGRSRRLRMWNDWWPMPSRKIQLAMVRLHPRIACRSQPQRGSELFWIGSGCACPKGGQIPIGSMRFTACTICNGPGSNGWILLWGLWLSLGWRFWPCWVCGWLCDHVESF